MKTTYRTRYSTRHHIRPVLKVVRPATDEGIRRPRTRTIEREIRSGQA